MTLIPPKYKLYRKTSTAIKYNHIHYIGKPCRNGHGGIRYVKCNRCVYCMAKRYKQILRATPKWITPLEILAIKDMFTLAVTISEATQVLHSVDHYYPLFGKNVSGLHTIQNLRIITHDENMRKKNKHPKDFYYEIKDNE